MQVETVVHSTRLALGQEGLRLRKVLAIPREATPARPVVARVHVLLALAAIGGTVAGVVPVHVRNQDIGRHAKVVKLAQQLDALPVGHRPPARVPRTKRVPRWHRLRATHQRQVSQRRLEIQPMCKDVDVGTEH